MVGALDIATAGVLTWVGTNLVMSTRQGLRSESRRRSATIVRGLRPRNFVAAVPVLGAVLAVASVLLGIPPLRFGWWTAIGGQGNPVVGSSSRFAGSPLEWLVPAVFVFLLVPLLPMLAEREEWAFRASAEHWPWPRRVRRCVEFGLAHALIGIPIGVALALSIGGAYFMAVYLRAARRDGPQAGVEASTRAHLAYNLTIAVVVVAALVLGA